MSSDSILEQFTSFQKKKNVFIYFYFISHSECRPSDRDDPREWHFVNEG